MATDHRGRGVHAGKRTYQTYDDGDRFTWSLDTPTLGEYTHRNVRNALYADTDRYETDQVGDMASGRGELGRNKWVADEFVPGSSMSPSQGVVSVRGTVRTPERARIAAESMNKRINEGRNLKTGRPKK